MMKHNVKFDYNLLGWFSNIIKCEINRIIICFHYLAKCL